MGARFSTGTLLLAAAALWPSRAAATACDPGMQAVLKEYLKIHASLIEDSAKGVAAAAEEIERLSRRLVPKAATGEAARRCRAMAGEIRGAAARLKRAREVAGIRQAYKALSRPVVDWVKLARPAGVRVAYCEMVKAAWVQTEKGIRNPYHGSQMLYCGEFVKHQPRARGP